MKLLPQVQDIINKYDLKPIELPDSFKNLYDYLRNDAYIDKQKDFKPRKSDIYFLDKYQKYIRHGWYGFSLGYPIVPEWCDIIDEILELCTKYDSYFEIHEIRIKKGSVHFNVYSGIIDDCSNINKLIMKILFDKALIY